MFQIGGRRWLIAEVLAAAGLFLLIACANVAGLLVTGGAERDREFAIRTVGSCER
jgi:hypothetical protein